MTRSDTCPIHGDTTEPGGNHVHVYLNRSGPDDDLHRTRDSAMLPGAPKPPSHRKPFDDQDDPDAASANNDPRVVAELPPPPPDKHYEVEMREGVCAVVLAEGAVTGPYQSTDGK